MHTFQYKICLFQNDINGYAPPSLMIHLGGFSAFIKSCKEGLTSRELYEKLGAVWMYARLSLKQLIPVKAGDVLDMECAPRIRDGAAYLRLINFRCYGELVATMELVSMAVSMSERKIIRPSVIESTWDLGELSKAEKRLRRLPVRDDLRQIDEIKVRYSECDENRHLNSAQYADYICDSCGYWEGNPKIMDELQIDFISESKAGDRITLLGDIGGDEGYIRGITQEGTPGFNSKYKMSQL